MADIEEYGGFWEEFNDDTRFVRMQEEEEEPTGSLAKRVVESFGLDCKGTLGGPLATVDLKRMDALKAINASLLESFARGETSSFVETVVDEDGLIDFKTVGSYTGLEDVDIYHTIQTQVYTNICRGVMVHGGKPTPRRRTSTDNPPAEWLAVWGPNPEDKEIYTTADKMLTNCLKENFDQFATIVFNDPHIRNSSYNDGIDNLYEITKGNSWDNIVGYAIRKEYTNDTKLYMENRPEITVDYINQCSIPIEVSKIMYIEETPPDGWVPTVGPLVFAPVAPSDFETDPGCWTQPSTGGVARYPDESRPNVNAEWAKDNGTKIIIPEKFRFEINEEKDELKLDKLNGISKVYLQGIYMDSCQGFPESDEDQLLGSTQTNTKLLAIIEDPATKIFEAKEGVHYKIYYYPEGEESDGTFKTPYLVFADNSRVGDNAKFGDDCAFYISPECEYAQSQDLTSSDAVLYQTGQTIIPTNGVEAMWVKQIWVLADVETPGIKVYDPDGGAKGVAEGLSYLMKPLVLIDKPAPIGYAGESSPSGRVIDLVSGKQDHDPTTAQDLSDTDFEEALDEMSVGGSGLSLTLSFLIAEKDEDVSGEGYDEGEILVRDFSTKLYNYMTERDGIQTTYICGPSTKVNIGGAGLNTGTVINSVDYSYNDGGSYTISVNEGTKLHGAFAEISQGVAQTAVEDVSATGTVIQDMGNNLHYKVRIDGYGERIGINTCPSVIRVGDRVSVSVHNNPVEL
jgi:hypothetical protein